MRTPSRRFVPIAFVISCLAISGVVTTTAGADDHAIVRGELGAELDAWLAGMETFGMHGALLVEKGGEVVIAKGYGTAQRDPHRPITKDTSFHIGSLGKQFTAACVLKLQMMGRLRVEDPIARHLQDVPEDKRGVTIHHLLTHTAGLPYMPSDDSPLALELLSAPGERHRYANPGYTLLAMIVERVSGTTLDRFAQEHLFGPAGMTRSCFVGAATWPTDDVASSFQGDTNLGRVSDMTPDEAFRGAGDVATCVGDLLKWERALRGETILDEAARTQFFSEHVRNEGSRVGYAYGWMTATTERGTRVVFHQGNFGGFNADYRRYLDEDLVIIFLSNHFVDGRSMRDAVTNHVSRIVAGQRGVVPVPPSVVAVAPGRLADWTGRYALESGEPIDVEVGAGGVVLRGWGQSSLNLIHAPDATADVLEFADRAVSASEAIVRGAAEGDDAPLREHASRSIRVNGLWTELRWMVEGWRTESGALTDIEVLGTALADRPGYGRTLVRLTFERGEHLMQLDRGAGGGVFQVSGVSRPAGRTFLAADETGRRLVAFDIFSGMAAWVALEGAGDGAALVFETASGTVRAARVGT